MNSMAADYGIPLGSQAVDRWIGQIEAGTATIDDYQAYLVGQAKARFPYYAQQLDAGATVRQLWDPFAQIAAQTLGVVPNTLNMADPKWLAALEIRDPKTGEVRPMTIAEWQTYIRQRPEYGYESAAPAKNDVASFISMLGDIFGRT